ncbi:MAG: TrkA family potassium uptake protein [Deltaproteobacteria bacterium]|nr:TrkA family potassium uptake protein [Deltaproteobacteria bacterium]
MEVAIIGLGSFGSNLARELYQHGHRLTAIDLDEKVLSKVNEVCEQAVVGDARDRTLLEELGLSLMDAAVIGLGEDLGASILITLHLKEMGVETIVAKALSAEHEKILFRVGATRVIFPERDAAERLARSLSDPNLLDYLPLAGDYTVAEWTAPDSLVGKSLAELDLRRRYEVSVIAVRENGGKQPKVIVSPGYKFNKGDILLLLGRQQDLERLSKE